jgi:dTDP-4-amino-4,6-dideoxygalactose transaminase
VSVPTKDYARQYGPLWAALGPALERVFFEDEPILGEAVDAFERGFAARHGPECLGVGTASGTDAALLLYRALGFGPGDEVVTNAHTFSGVISALLLAGLVPRLVDPDPETGRLRPADVAAAIGPRTRAVLAVHMHGHPEPADALADLCGERGVLLLEDCAQAHGARWRGRPVGTYGHAAIYSFHPSKNLGAFGDAGLLLTADPALAERVRVLRNLGKAGKYTFDTVGPNAKLDTLQATILNVKLPHLDAWTERRRALARRYLSGLADVSGLRLPEVDPAAEPVWHLFVVHTPDRDALRAHMAARGIATGLHYPIAAHDQPGLAPALVHCGSMPVARRLAAECLTLPLSHEHTDDEIDQTIKAVAAWR